MPFFLQWIKKKQIGFAANRERPSLPTQEQIQGSILGAACGDALGMATEGLNRQKIQESYGWVADYRKPVHRTKNAGQWTDDTEQMLLLTEALIEAKGFEFQTYYIKMLEFARKFINQEIPNRGYGPTSKKAFQNLVVGISPSGVYSPSCGAAMKIAPLGLFYADNPPETICQVVRECALLTHSHPESISGACAIAVAVAVATRPNVPIAEIITAGIEAADSIEGGIAPHLKIMLSKVQNSNTALQKVLKAGFSAKATVGICFGILARFANYKEAVEQAINFGGDTDSYASMIGSILGAKEGIACIPARWLEGLEAKDRIQALATQLYRARLP